MEKIKVAYVASPVKFFFIGRTEQQAIRAAMTHAANLAKQAKDMGFVVISTPMMYLKIHNELTERHRALRDSIILLKRSDVFFYSKNDYSRSKGLQDELEIAKELGMEVVEID